MRYSLWKWFRKLFSNYSNKTIHLYRIFLFKVDVYLLNRKKNKCFKQIGKTFYLELLDHKEIEQIIEIIQPTLSLIDKIDRKIEDLHSKIFKIAKQENIPVEQVKKIDNFIKNADKKMKDSIFDEEDDFEEDDLENIDDTFENTIDNYDKNTNFKELKEKGVSSNKSFSKFKNKEKLTKRKPKI